VLRAGNVAFTPDGNSLISPVGNRVTVFNLASSTSVTLPFEHVKGAPSAQLRARKAPSKL
jgi:periodic tryptophan protein 2